MGNAKFKLMEKKLDLDQIEGKYSAFAKVPYALPVKMNKPLAKDGYGSVVVDGIAVSKGEQFVMEVMGKMQCMLVPVGEAVKEYDKEYTITFSGFTAEDGSKFASQSFQFRTLPRKQKNPAYKAHDKVALQAAREGMVLLRNKNGILPLKADSVLNCFGRAQYIFRNTSTGASLINPRWQANFHQSVKEHSSFVINKEVSSLYNGLKDVVPSSGIMERAKLKNDTAILIVSRTSGEFLDNKPIKGGYYLTDDEMQMVEAVSSCFSKTIAILNTGYPIEMGWVKEYGIDAVIYTGFAGMCAGYALMEILDGRTNPSGKLPDTWSYDYYDNPASRNFINFSEEDEIPGEKDKGVRLYYEEDIYVGYRYFDTFAKEAAYSFGHGLSYTVFEYRTDNLTVREKNISLDISVKNVGNMVGKEVIQCYVSAPEKQLEKPSRVLTAFEKTKLLSPDEEQKFTLTADKMNFASFDEEKGCYILEAGVYKVYCGTSLTAAKEVGCFTIDTDENLRTVNRINIPVENFHKMTKQKPYVLEDSKMVELSEQFSVRAKRPNYYPKALIKKERGRITFDKLLQNPKLLDSFVAQMSDRELCRLNVCGGANWYLPFQDGCAGKTNVIKKYKMPQIKVSDGNTGLNIRKANIGFPCSTVIAATFNKELAYQVGQVIGEESKENGIAINLGPGMNIHRNILNGRHPEYFSEDPYLAGTMAGMHGKGIADTGIGCTYKHLFCNNSDTSRKGSQSIVSERALREIYYRVFEIAFTIQKPTCVMTSYNSVNGIYPAENAEVLQKLVRGEWGFDGLIMTDWGTYDTVDAVEMVKAGNCWLTEGNRKYQKELMNAVKSGRLSRGYLENNVKYLVETILRTQKK